MKTANVEKISRNSSIDKLSNVFCVLNVFFLGNRGELKQRMEAVTTRDDADLNRAYSTYLNMTGPG
jgi:hypothetical protein